MESVNSVKWAQTHEEPSKLEKASRESRPTSASSEITIREFLDFLKTAYQVTDSVEGLLLADGKTDVVDWLRLKESGIVKPRAVACQTSDSKIKSEDKKELARKKSDGSSTSGSDPAENVKRKLSDVLSEGIMDSVLTYLVPSTTTMVTNARRNSQHKLNEKINSSVPLERTLSLRKSTESCVTSKSSVIKSEK